MSDAAVNLISPRHWLRQALADTISQTLDILLTPTEIPLTVCDPKYNAHYTSAIAFAFAHRLDRPALDIATQLARQLQQWRSPALANFTTEMTTGDRAFQATAVGQGWLNFYLTDTFVASCLWALYHWQPAGYIQMSDVPLWLLAQAGGDALPLPNTDTKEFNLPYAHARCCALLRLAQREGLWQFAQAHNRSGQLTLTPQTTEEHRLLVQHLAIADFLVGDHPVATTMDISMKLCRNLATSFLTFYDRCRLFGINHETACTRLLLVSITQKLAIVLAPTWCTNSVYL